MRLWPRSFFARNLLLIIGMFFVAQLASWTLFLSLVQRQRMEHFAPFIVAQTQMLRTALRGRDAAARALFLASIRKELAGRLDVSEAAPVDASGTPNVLVAWFFGLLRPSLAAGQEAIWQSTPRPVLWVKTPVDSNVVYWIGFPAAGFVLEPRNLVAALLIVSLMVAVAGAALIQFGLIPPLKTLESAALQVGEGHAAQPVTRPMPLELERVAGAFNRMQESLNARDSERSLMLAGISHDLRTPLTKLWLGVEMLEGKADAELLAQLAASVQAADRIVTQFIDFARDGATEPLSRCDLSALLRSAAIEAVEDRNALRVDCEPMPQCLVRTTALRRIVANLTNNAARYGAAPIVLQAAWSEGYLRVSVTDHGLGVPESALTQLTRPFMRLRDERPTSGTGLGLAIVDRLIRSQGGRLELRNRAGAGLRAEFWIPAPADALATTGPSDSSPA